MPEQPLHEWEIKMVRGMIDEHRRRLDRERDSRRFWTTSRVTLAAILGLITFLLNLAISIKVLTH